MASSIFLRPQGTNAVSGLLLVGEPSMTLTASATVNMGITPTGSGVMAAGAQTLTATTNSPAGYTLAITGGSSAAQLLTNAASISSPIALGSNTWGFAMNQVSSSSAANTITNGFDASYAVPTPSNTSKWADPLLAPTIKNTSQKVTNDVTTVYYGIKADTALTAGTYTSNIQYAATANTSTIVVPTIISVTPSSGPTTGGTPITIIGTGFTVDDASITTAVTIGTTACVNVTISSNTPISGQDTIYCNTPARAAGTVSAIVATWGGTATRTSAYTYIAPAVITSVSPSLASTIAGKESGPSFTIVGTSFTGATTVKIGDTTCTSFTIVSSTLINCIGANSYGLTTGDKSVVIDKSGVTSNDTIKVTYTDEKYPTMQSDDSYSQCSTTPTLFRDERDSQLYYVKRMVDNKCWMVDNLKYAGFGDLVVLGKYLTADGTNTQTAENVDVAKFADGGSNSYCSGSVNMPTSTNTRCGFLYSWYTATEGTGTFDMLTNGSQATGSICPANFRLPSTTSGTAGPTTAGTSVTRSDFTVLNASMNAGTLTTGVRANYLPGWQPDGAWQSVFAGNWSLTTSAVGTGGYYHSSTIGNSVDSVLNNGLYGIDATTVDLYVSNVKNGGFAMRCVMEDPEAGVPAGTNPPNISSTNPAVLDVYPTTGWGGDTVAITSNGLFTSVTNVTIGGTACISWRVVNSSLVSCVLPTKTSGTTNNIIVTNGGTNVTNASTYTHMKVTYFDPSASSVTINSVAYSYYPDGFTSANCSALTASNADLGNSPANSIAYVRDTRNGQVYRVKKMVDNKCWMVDNLKYIDTTIANTADGTTGMAYNSGDHINSGTTGKYNTVDGGMTQSSANTDKAIYNNPMAASGCYSSTYLPSGSLTHCGYLYNWYAASAGSGTYAAGTAYVQASDSICPANFRLPSARSGSTGSSNGSSLSAADFPVLNASMNAGTLTTGSTTSYPGGWQFTSAWGGSFSGRWDEALVYQGGAGYFWSSTISSSTYVYGASQGATQVTPGNANYYKYSGLAARCVIE
ncbi:MAG: IPT/TIG domain-containing protein [Candidatus Saccharimonadales bacterium]